MIQKAGYTLPLNLCMVYLSLHWDLTKKILIISRLCFKNTYHVLLIMSQLILESLQPQAGKFSLDAWTYRGMFNVFLISREKTKLTNNQIIKMNGPWRKTIVEISMKKTCNHILTKQNNNYNKHSGMFELLAQLVWRQVSQVHVTSM